MAAVAWYRQCTSCKKLMPYIQIRCDCGERFTGSERIFKVCPACGSVLDPRRFRCDCGYLFVFRRFLGKQCAPEATQSEDAYRAGVMAERAKNDAEWDRFFETAQLKNTISGTPIRSREDFYKWAEEFAAAKAERDRRAKEEADRFKVQRRTSVRYGVQSKEDIACDVILKYATKIENAVSSKVSDGVKDFSFYVSVGALCTWAELVMREQRAVVQFVVGDVAEKANSEGREKVADLKRLMYTSADMVGLAMEGTKKEQIFVSASAAIQRLLQLEKDVEVQLEISSILVDFTRDYQIEKKYGI